MAPRNFGHRSPRLGQLFQTYDEPVYFVTFCTHKREAQLASGRAHLAFIGFAERALRDFDVAVGRYVLMPDHFHLFVCGGDDFVLGRYGWSKPKGQIWQEGFFDHVVRNDESMSQKWEYIRQNPVRAGLVDRSTDWPFQGEIVPLDRV